MRAAASEDAGRASPLPPPPPTSRRESAVRRQEAVSHRSGTVALSVSTSFRLGGLLLLQGPDEEASVIMLQLMAGLVVPHSNEVENMYLPPYLKYSYCPELPVLFEGSILKNLMLGVQRSLHGAVPTADEAWQVAEWCGLDSDFLRAPESFNVGKNGRNLPLWARQSVCLARCLLSDPCVLLLDKPVTLATAQQAEQVLRVLRRFVDLGGLWGMLTGNKVAHHATPTSFLTGHGTRTVLMTAVPEALQARYVSRLVRFESAWDVDVLVNRDEPLEIPAQAQPPAPDVNTGTALDPVMVARGAPNSGARPLLSRAPRRVKWPTIHALKSRFDTGVASSAALRPRPAGSPPWPSLQRLRALHDDRLPEPPAAAVTATEDRSRGLPAKRHRNRGVPALGQPDDARDEEVSRLKAAHEEERAVLLAEIDRLRQLHAPQERLRDVVTDIV